MELVNIQNTISSSDISWDSLWVPGQSNLCRTGWSHVTLVHTPVSPLVLIRSFLAPLAWSTFGVSSIPQAEAAVCHCNCMLIERREPLTISCSFSPQLLFLTIPLSSLTFIFFSAFTMRSLRLVHVQNNFYFQPSVIYFVAHFSSCYVPTGSYGLFTGVLGLSSLRALTKSALAKKEMHRRPVEEHNSLQALT